jgi:hypothetical protein
MPTCNSFQYGNFVSNLQLSNDLLPFYNNLEESTYHVFPSMHKFFIDHLASIILSSFDVYAFLDDSVGS